VGRHDRAQLIDGVALSAPSAPMWRARRGADARGQPPGLAVILVGDDPASAVYVRNKVKACASTACTRCSRRTRRRWPSRALLARIAALNADPAIHGILVQMPLPRHIDPQKVIEPSPRPRTSTASRCCPPAS
jgi:methylenetetrahydrofolate dehydrogenase (NADP+)/methenyltetrahydrofolate cyclohydrolase